MATKRVTFETTFETCPLVAVAIIQELVEDKREAAAGIGDTSDVPATVSSDPEPVCCRHAEELDEVKLKYNAECELLLLREKVKLYTGLPSYTLLMKVFKFVSHDVPQHNHTTTSKFTQFLITLIKLHLNLHDADIEYRFGIHQNTVSRLVLKWINIMYVRLRPLIRWSDRPELRMTMPTEFAKHFKGCVCIIDRFKIFVGTHRI